MLHVIQWSGGIGSWATTELVRREHPDEPITLLFADVLVEDSNLSTGSTPTLRGGLARGQARAL